MLTKEQWTAILTCINAAENSDSTRVWEASEVAREWFETQEWKD